MSTTATASVDLSDLLTVTVNSKTLTLVLSTVQERLDNLEAATKAQAAQAPRKASVGGDAADAAGAAAKDRGGVGGVSQSGPSAVAGEDYSAAIRQLQSDLALERQQRVADVAALNDALEAAKAALAEERARAGAAEQQLQGGLDALSGDLSKTKDDLAALAKVAEGLEERKADKRRDVDPLAKEIDWIKAELSTDNAAANALQARVATLEGMKAAEDPEAAKANGLTSFTDTLNDVLNRQKALDDKVSGLERRVEADGQAVQHDLDGLRKQGDGLEAQARDAARDMDAAKDRLQALPTHEDIDTKTREAIASIRPTPAQAQAAPQKDAAAQGLTDSDRAALQTLPAALARWKELEKRLEGQLAAAPAAAPQTSAVSAPVAGAGGASSEGLERRVAALEDATRRLQDEQGTLRRDVDGQRADIAANKEAVAAAGKEIKVLGQECSKNAADCKMLHERKADKSDLLNLAQAQQPRGGQPAAGPSAPEVAHKLSELQRLLDALDGRVSGLQQDKASRESMQTLAKEIADLRATVKGLSAVASAGGAGDRGLGGGAAGAVNAEAAADVERRLSALEHRLGDVDEWARNQLLEVRATVDHIHHSKADAALVANKAERDYVENAMEKLMHEVETVLNATNAGLIDTLDKSLNILRDMIDGKATKQDVTRLQAMVHQPGDDGSGVPDGLTGYKSYRCLGCNRTMDAMRPRPMGGTMNTFINRVPTNARQTVSSQGARPSPTSGVVPAIAASPTTPQPVSGYLAQPPKSS